jgi:hypothetical protein
MTDNKKFVIQKSQTSVSQNSHDAKRNFVITKRIAKHGSQAVIVVPRIIEQHLKPGTIVQLSIEVISNSGEIVEEKIKINLGEEKQ